MVLSAGGAKPPSKGQNWKSAAAPPPRSALLTLEDWQKAPITALEPGEIDRLVARELEQSKVKPAPLTTDEQFIRRVSLDLTGKLPSPSEVTAFVSNSDPNKRSRLIDECLASDGFARHWAAYWRDVIAFRLTDVRSLVMARSFEEWLFQQLRSNQNWARIARSMLTAAGPSRVEEPGDNGAVFFLGSHTGRDADNERAAETSRVFLGIQLQCAQCHDHPSDQWKRVQFHELSAYFARTGEKPLRNGKMYAGMELVSLTQGEHEMPSKEDPKKSFITYPRFLDGSKPGQLLGDHERRQALADSIVNPKNYWFAAAFVNRIWGELMGQSFYQPVDDLGPKKVACFTSLLTRLTGSFRASHYDIKGLFRDIMISEAYQRQIRLGESTEEHLHFAAAYPTRLRPDALWHSLTSVLGDLGPAPAPANRPRQMLGLVQGLEATVRTEFGFDPSLKPDEVEGSVSQALLMMNNPVINQRIQARGSNLLAKLLQSNPGNDEALAALYLHALARRPTEREVKKCQEYLAQAGNRAEGFEDILWTLLNSTEFQTKR
jgi:hypothetical protein